jgi:hypothetical protein
LASYQYKKENITGTAKGAFVTHKRTNNNNIDKLLPTLDSNTTNKNINKKERERKRDIVPRPSYITNEFIDSFACTCKRLQARQD